MNVNHLPKRYYWEKVTFSKLFTYQLWEAPNDADVMEFSNSFFNLKIRGLG